MRAEFTEMWGLRCRSLPSSKHMAVKTSESEQFANRLIGMGKKTNEKGNLLRKSSIIKNYTQGFLCECSRKKLLRSSLGEWFMWFQGIIKLPFLDYGLPSDMCLVHQAPIPGMLFILSFYQLDRNSFLSQLPVQKHGREKQSYFWAAFRLSPDRWLQQGRTRLSGTCLNVLIFYQVRYYYAF